MHQCEMTLIIDRHQIMVILVDLDWRQLALVNDVLVAQGTEVKPIVETDGMGGALSQDEKLALEM